MSEPTSLSAVYPVSRDTLWEAWTRADKLAAWHPEEASSDLAPGSTVEYRWPSLGLSMELSVTGWDPGHSLVLVGGPSGRPPETLCVEFADAEEGASIRVKHDGFGNAQQKEGTLAGWRASLHLLGRALQQRVERHCRSLVGTVVGDVHSVSSMFALPGFAFALDAGPVQVWESDATSIVFRVVSLDEDARGAKLVSAQISTFGDDVPLALEELVSTRLERGIEALSGTRASA